MSPRKLYSRYLQPPILLWPGENGLDVKALTNALFIIRSYALSQRSLDIINA